MGKTRVYVSLGYDHEETLKTFLVGQAKNEESPFSLADWSIKEHIDENWKAKAKVRIQAADVVCVIYGEHTDTAAGVSVELRIAQEQKKPHFPLNGYANRTSKRPQAALSTDKHYDWTWHNLKILVGGGR